MIGLGKIDVLEHPIPVLVNLNFRRIPGKKKTTFICMQKQFVISTIIGATKKMIVWYNPQNRTRPTPPLCLWYVALATLLDVVPYLFARKI